MNKKRRFVLVVLCTLVVLAFALSLSASASSTDSDIIINYQAGYFGINLSNSQHLSGINNGSGTPYAIYENAIARQDQTLSESMHSIALYTRYAVYNATTKETISPPSGHIYCPVAPDSYMSVPTVESNDAGETVYTFPYAMMLSQSNWWSFKFDGAYQHCRFSVSVDNDKNLVVLYNPTFYDSYTDFLGAYNNQANPKNYIGELALFDQNALAEEDSGYNSGYNAGYSVGFNDGKNNAVTPIGILFSGVNSVLSIKLFGDVTLGLIVYSALGLGALFVVMKMFSK